MQSVIKFIKVVIIGAGGWILYLSLKDLYNGGSIRVVSPTLITLLVIGIIILVVLNRIEKKI